MGCAQDNRFRHHYSSSQRHFAAQKAEMCHFPMALEMIKITRDRDTKWNKNRKGEVLGMGINMIHFKR